LRIQLIVQFFSESLLVVAFAFVLSLLIIQLTLPVFNNVADKKMSVPWNNPLFWLMGLGFSFIAGFIAGSYPALYLSSFNPVKVLKGTFKVGRFASLPRKVLVVLQFTVSVILIIGTIVVFRQIQFAQNRPIGYNRNGLVLLPMMTSDIHKHFDVVENELIKSGAIVSMAESGSPTTAVWGTNSGFDWKGKDPSLSVEFPNTDVSHDFGKTIGWQFIDGRDFSRDYVSDTTSFVINESAAKFMNLKNPVGEILKWDGVPFKIVGVIKDMIVETPYSPVRPSLYHMSVYPSDVVIAKINPNTSTNDALSKIENVFKKYNPSQPFDYKFVDEDYAKKFGNEQRIGKLASAFAALAIFISCLGLFGMASFVTEQRTKEIGVRKVLGASVLNLWQLLSKDFVVLITISLLIATPVGYYFMHKWLLNYQYRTEISWWIFAASAIGAFVITILTVSFQAIKAAVANPVKSLRTE
jgi:putative ABC transport system permease protein